MPFVVSARIEKPFVCVQCKCTSHQEECAWEDTFFGSQARCVKMYQLKSARDCCGNDIEQHCMW